MKYLDYINIREAYLKDVDQLASAHFELIKPSLLSTLGKSFLKKEIYTKLIKNAKCKIFLAEGTEGYLGHIVVAKNAKIFENELSRLSPGLIISVIKNPLAIKPILDILFKKSKFTKCKILKDFENSSEIFAICVDVESQSKGVGRKLINYGMNVSTNKSWIVKTHTKKAVNFYKKTGNFELIGIEKRGDLLLYVLGA